MAGRKAVIDLRILKISTPSFLSFSDGLWEKKCADRNKEIMTDRPTDERTDRVMGELNFQESEIRLKIGFCWGIAEILIFPKHNLNAERAPISYNSRIILLYMGNISDISPFSSIHPDSNINGRDI